MERIWTTWVTTLGGMASIAVLAMAVCDPMALSEQSSEERAEEEHLFNPWMHEEEEAEHKSVAHVEKPSGEKRWVRMIDDEERGVDAEALVSAPGMWPFQSTETKRGGFLALPSVDGARIDGGELELYELLVRSNDSGDEDEYGFWGLVHGPGEIVVADKAHEVRMEEAAALEFVVVDTDGEPVEEAYARLSRDSVGLVHIHEKTEEDGLASFRAIPPGSYYVTLDADGYERTTLRVEHSEELSTNLHVTLEDGSGVRAPQAWRGPSVQEMVAQSEAEVADAPSGDAEARSTESSSGSTGASPSDGGASEGGTEESQGGDTAGGDEGVETTEIAVRVDDDSGSAVQDAWIEVWAAGERVAEGRSRGWDRERLEVPQGADVDIVATHSGWGEGSTTLSNVGDGDQAVVRLEDLVPSQTPAQDRLVWLDDIEEALDVEVVETRRGLRLDPESGGAGASAGVERGDTLYFVRRQGSGYLALVERGGEFVEIAVR